MQITGDYHTHSKYSKNFHGKNTIGEMVDFAKDLGLEGLAITDHGPKHIFFGIKRKNILKAKEEVKRLKKEKNFNVYFGIEANLIKRNGEIDLTEEELKNLDILIVGYHKGTITDFYNPFRNKEKQKQINTEAYINCLNRYKVDIISHLNEYIKVDVKAVAEAAKERGTIIELNNKHIKFSVAEAKQLIDSGCKFILSSDAHKKENIATFDRALDFIEKYKIDKSRIVNIENIYK